MRLWLASTYLLKSLASARKPAATFLPKYRSPLGALKLRKTKIDFAYFHLETGPCVLQLRWPLEPGTSRYGLWVWGLCGIISEGLPACMADMWSNQKGDRGERRTRARSLPVFANRSIHMHLGALRESKERLGFRLMSMLNVSVLGG